LEIPPGSDPKVCAGGAQARRNLPAFLGSAAFFAVCAGMLGGIAVRVEAQGSVCVVGAQVGEYLKPDGAVLNRVSRAAVLAEQARRPVVLLGEQHDSAEDHRWQLHTIAQLHALQPNIAVGFEMFPRRLQPVLDRWVLGELGEADFLRQSEWDKVWGYPSGPYLGLFHYARMNRVPMLALNVDRGVVSAVAQKGASALSDAERQGVGLPTPPSEAYRRLLREAFDAHPPITGTTPSATVAEASPGTLTNGVVGAVGAFGVARSARDAGFERFVAAQTFWDRAMAEAIATFRQSNPSALVIGVMGSGHVRFGYGVAHQLGALGIAQTGLLHTLERSGNCDDVLAGSADGVYVVEKPLPEH
jgi:uncharacterized iron-regulated protein